MESGKTFTCSVDGCRKCFTRKDRLDVHIRTHTGDRPYVCHYDGCASSYARQQHLTRHINRSHIPGFKDKSKVRCPNCNLELANSSCLKKHIHSFHNVPSSHCSYKCTEEGCSESFHKKKQLVVHKLQKHSDHLTLARKCYTCTHEGCGKMFTFPQNLKHHMKVHQGYACSVEGCSQILPTWSSLRKHRAVEHTPTHACTVCGAVFKKKSNWKQHIKIHSVSQTPHTCSRENCGRLFLYKKNLTQHIREFHDGEAIWRNRPRKKSNKSYKKHSVSKKKSFAARLCGFDVHDNENVQDSTEVMSDLQSSASIKCVSVDSSDNCPTSANLYSEMCHKEPTIDCNMNGLVNVIET